jgi:hypothetical protein
MAHAQKPDFVFRRNGQVHLNRRGVGGHQFSRLPAAWGVRNSGSTAGYTMFRGSVKCTGYPLHSPVSPWFPRTCVTVCHHISPAFCPICNAHSPYYIVICDLSGCTIFFHITSQTARFFEKKLLNTKCVFWFSLQLLSETFLISRRTERDIIKNVYRSSCEVPVILVRFEWKWNFLGRSSEIFKYEI